MNSVLMKRIIPILALLLWPFLNQVFAQATKSYPFAVGGNANCGGTSQIHFYNYNGTTNTISNATGGMVNVCIPELRYGGANTQRFTRSLASVSFNPKDHKIYYLLTIYSPTTITYAWSWPLGTCPTVTTPSRRVPDQQFNADILGVAFDNNGNGYIIEFTGALPTTPPTYKAMIRSIDFATGTLGVADTLVMTGGAKIYQQGSGDVVMTPSGQMFFVVDNKLFTPDYKSYTGTGANVTCTYIDTVINSATGSYVGLTYADGEMMSAYSGGGCPFYETNMITAGTANITKSGTVFSASDLATVVSGIGAAKKLVSVTPTGTPKQYDVVYDVYIQNYGNMDVKNVQVTDDLKAINGNANVAFTSAVFTDNPAGLVLNPSYNGKTDINLLNGTGTLSNYPVANNHATIRITCRLSNINPGVVYNNSAIATAVDFNGNNLKDSSTNGSKPDLNSNDKPDDLGEGQPTPLLIAVAASSTPCVTLGQTIYRQTFGSGTGRVTAFPMATGGSIIPTSTYAGTVTAPVPVERYTISDNAINGDAAKWLNMTDHTGGANGRMLLVNADAQPNTMYRDLVASACGGQQYSFTFYGAFIGNSSYQTICDGFGGFKYPKVMLRVRDAISGAIIAQFTTADITSTSWQQYGMKWVMPTGFSSVYLELVNDGEGGCGNDLAIDDIEFGLCSPAPVVNIGAVSGGCLGGSTTFSATLSDPTAIPGSLDYQWQVATALAGPYTNIPGATSSSYTINPVGPGDVGKYYRVIVAATGNMGIPSCEYISTGYLLTAKNPSVAATSATSSHSSVCPGKTVALTAVGGTLGTNAVWRWYSGSCGGTLVGTGATINVTVNANTTYFVRAEGDCNVTTCQQVTVTINCDIDKDKDGIPDFVESNMPAAFGDADGDGIINAYDTDYPGFVDNNGDFINDNFQADGDSDGDGIPNYLDTTFPGRVDTNGDGVDDRFDSDLDGIINMLDLDSDNDGIPDVVEAGGVDQNGDGKIDNFVDSDGDGLSDQVDASLGGAYNSGVGLGLKDTDGDGVANQFDLDSDNDGIPDVREVGGADANNDGMIDGFVDSNNDGISDNILLTNALLRTGADTNSDGRADSYPYHNMDKDGVPNPYDLDSDGDGITDVLEANLPDVNFDGRVDGALGTKGWSAVVDAMPALNLPNTDGDANPDYLDIDSDNDGITDHIEGPSTGDYKMPLGTDADNDGIDDVWDTQKFVWGGNGVFPVDMDGDYIPDYRDLDTDGDGSPDIKEGHDYNFDGVFNEITTLTGVDTDGDGLDDRFDLDNTSAKGTSSNLGNGGSTFGDPSPGTKAVVQKTPPLAGNRDWRWLPYVLPLNVVTFNGTLSGYNAALTWEILSPEDIRSFEIFRSTDNIHFTQVGALTQKLLANQQRRFNFNDDVSMISDGIIFYRLQITGASGKHANSDVIRLHTRNQITEIVIKPNPANQFATIAVPAIQEGNAQIKILNNTGKVVKALSEKLFRGTNTIHVSELQKLPGGVYTVHILADGNSYISKLVIIH